MRRASAFLHRPLCSLAQPTSAYVHLPFCAQRCAYCAFPVIVSGRSAARAATAAPPLPPPPPAHVAYVDLLCREIRAVSLRWPRAAAIAAVAPHPPLATLYLGGGTPSLLHPALLRRVLRALRAAFPLAPRAELTCEMDPATFSLATAEQFRALGINRASVGAQSFDDTLLRACNRLHTVRDVHVAVQALRRAGFDNLSLDLISALPGQTLHMWTRSLEEAVALAPQHVAAYDLTLEKGTAFGDKYRGGVAPLPSEHRAAEMMTKAANVLGAAGYEHYEVSNFAGRLPQGEAHDTGPAVSPFRSRHNMAYWRNRPFYAFGLGATSVLDGFRFARPRRLKDYARYVDRLTAFTESSPDPQPDELYATRMADVFYPHVRKMTHRERLEDYLINSFRLLVEGVRLDEVREQFGSVAYERLVRALETCTALEEEGTITVDRAALQPTAVRLTERGALIENSVLATLMQEAIWKYPEDITDSPFAETVPSN